MEGLLSQVKSLSPVKQRAVAAVVGCIVADAASQPLHWVYKDDVMQQVVSADPTKPEFLTPPGNPFYHLPCGSQSPYGDQLMVLLRSMAKCKGLNLGDFGDAYFKAFCTGSPYDIPKKNLPIKGHWQNRTMTRFSDLHTQGKTAKDIDDDLDDPDCIARIMPIAMLYVGKPEYLSKAEEGFLMLQSSDICRTSMTIAARLIEMYILNGEDRDKDGEGNVEKLIKILKSTPGIDPDERSFSSLLNQVVSDKQLSVKEATLKFEKA